MVFLAGVGRWVEGLVEGYGGCGGGVEVRWEAIAWVLGVERSGDAGLRGGGDVGLYAGEWEVAWWVLVSDESCVAGGFLVEE